MKYLLSVLIIFIGSLSVTAQGIEFDHTSTWKELKEKAKAQNKLIFIDAFTTWCGPCKMMAKDVFPDASVGSFFNTNFVNAKIDMEKGEGLEIAQQYGVRAYPTFLFIDGDGVLQHRSVGYHEAAEFVKVGLGALNPETRMGSLNAKYTKGERDPEFLYKLALAKREAYDAEAEKIAEEYFNTQKDWSTDKNLEMIYEFAGNLNSSLTKYYIDNKDKFENKYGKSAIARKTDQIISMASSSLTKTEKPDFDKIRELLVKIDAKHADQHLANIKSMHLFKTKDYNGYAKSTIEYFKKYPSEDPQELNSAAWNFYTCVDNKEYLNSAVEWGLKTIKLDDKYYCNDTVAALYTKLGNKSKAKKYISRAIELAKAEGQDYSETEALLKKL